MLKLDGMATFVAVAESGSISEASRRLNLSKSVVSERLADLEKELGVRLLHRSTRKLSLTEDGTSFLARASAIMRDVEDAAAELAQRRGSLVGPLRISAPVTFGRMLLWLGGMRTRSAPGFQLSWVAVSPPKDFCASSVKAWSCDWIFCSSVI